MKVALYGRAIAQKELNHFKHLLQQAQNQNSRLNIFLIKNNKKINVSKAYS